MRKEFFVTLEQMRNLVSSFSTQLSPGTWVFLEGDLGAGKTTFVQFLMTTLNKGTTQSPTFSILNVIQPLAEIQSNNSKNLDDFHVFSAILHMDLYRITSASELYYLGLDTLYDEKSLVLVEWASKLTEQEWEVLWGQINPPQQIILVTLNQSKENTAIRQITIETISN